MENQSGSNPEQNELKTKFNQLIRNIRNIIFNDKSLNSFSDGLISEIQNILKGKKMTNEIYEEKKKEFDDLLSEDKKNTQINNSNNKNVFSIPWQVYSTNILNIETGNDKEIKLIDNNICYSYYYSIFISIKDTN